MAEAIENEPFGNKERTPEAVAEKAVAVMRDFTRERMMELCNPFSYFPFWHMPNTKDSA